jgi:drug/metabolite transporter (DMT)-like permease
MRKQIRGTLLLLLATIIWGSAFIAQSVGMDLIGPFTFQAVRCGLAVIFLFPVSALLDMGKQDGKTFLQRWMDRKLWKAGTICGLALFVAASLQQVGLVYTDAGKAGFITAMYIVLVPILGIFRKQKPPKVIWFSVLLAVAGLYLLSCLDAAGINKGDILVLGCALAFAVQITCIDILGLSLDGVRLNCIQALVVSVLSLPFVLFTESVDVGNLAACWLPLGFAGILSMGVAYTLQIQGQKDLEPSTASLIMSLESVFAVLGGWLVLHESMTSVELLGCGLVFAAVIISQLPSRTK